MGLKDLAKAILKKDEFILSSYRHRAVERFAALICPDLKIGEFSQLWGKHPLEMYMDIEYSVTKSFRALERRVVLVNLFGLVEELDGCTAECGVAQGFASAYICKCVFGSRYQRIHYAIDTYEGLYASKIGEEEGKYWKEGDLSYSLEEVRRMLYELEGTAASIVQCIKGRIPDVLWALPYDAQYRFVHIDVDLAEPTDHALNYFYVRMMKGGIMLFDDYGYEQCAEARDKIFDFFLGSDKEKIVELPTGQAFVVKA
jgi:O-methyltransferase